jgi:hypothetical protein
MHYVQLKSQYDTVRLSQTYEGSEFDLHQRTQLGAIFAHGEGVPFIGKRILAAGWVRTIRYVGFGTFKHTWRQYFDETFFSSLWNEAFSHFQCSMQAFACADLIFR